MIAVIVLIDHLMFIHACFCRDRSFVAYIMWKYTHFFPFFGALTNRQTSVFGVKTKVFGGPPSELQYAHESLR